MTRTICTYDVYRVHIRERYVQFFLILFFLAIGTAVVQPVALGGQINARKKKELQSGTIALWFNG